MQWRPVRSLYFWLAYGDGIATASNEDKQMAKTNLTVRWDEVKVGDLIEHPWPKYRNLVGSLLEVTSIELADQRVNFGTPAGGDSRSAASTIEVTREV